MALLAQNIQAGFFTEILQKWKSCHPEIEHVTFHLVYPTFDLAEMTFDGVWSDLECLEIQESFGEIDSSANFSGEKSYPANIMRNVARSGANTEFIFQIGKVLN